MTLRPFLTTIALSACLLTPACMTAQGMSGMAKTAASKPTGPLVPPAQVFNKLLSGAEGEIVGAASAMPAAKFNFAPSASMGKYDGVRTYAAQIKHITEANYGFFQGWNVPGAKTRNEVEKLTDRDQILEALKASYTYAHAAMATITAQNAFVDMDGKGATRAGTAAYAIAHGNDHYGQMVEYLRMNGITPPASQR